MAFALSIQSRSLVHPVKQWARKKKKIKQSISLIVAVIVFGGVFCALGNHQNLDTTGNVEFIVK